MKLKELQLIWWGWRWALQWPFVGRMRFPTDGPEDLVVFRSVYVGPVELRRFTSVLRRVDEMEGGA